MTKKILILLPLLLLLSGCGSDTIYITPQENQNAPSDEPKSSGFSGADTVLIASAPGEIYVQITGAVQRPGVYTIEEGTRLYQLVELAGGFCEDAACDEINQVVPLSDGQLIKIPTLEEAAQAAQELLAKEDGLIDINSASLADLMTLPGIGESKALSIISYREEHGPFQTASDICNVPGIKENTYSKFRELITVR